jgi:lipopolysaccharide export system protein LptA
MTLFWLPLIPVTVPQSVTINPPQNHLIAQALKSDSNKNPLETELKPPSGVVEVYYDLPQAIPALPNSVPTLSQEGDSSLLKLDQNNLVPTTPQTNSALPTEQKEVIFGLNQATLDHKNRITKIIVTAKQTGEKREFQVPLVTQSPSGTIREAIQNDSTSQEVTTIEVISDYQEYDEQQKVLTARGNVTMRFSNGVLTADRLQVNLVEKLAVADGQVILTRGQQVLRGERFEYYLVQDSGVVFNANGEVYQPTTQEDFAATLPSDAGAGAASYQVLGDRLTANQPLQRITTNEGYQFVYGRRPNIVGQQPLRSTTGGSVNRLRYQAERLEFEGGVWNATNMRITNDPFSPPELEIRAKTATFRNIEPLVDELTLSDSRVVFDQRFSVPTFQDRLLFDRRNRRPNAYTIGYDGRDRGGFFLQRNFAIIDTPRISFQLNPQYLIQRAISPDSFPESNPNNEDTGFFSPSSFGLFSDLDIVITPRTEFQGTASFSSLNLENIADNVRSKLRIQQRIGDINNPYVLNVEYNYRERLFNGSLGFQTVEQSYGAIFLSPTIFLGNTGIILNYQTSLQNINADTDRLDLLPTNYTDQTINLTRFQSAFTLSKGFLLWAGLPLEPTPTAGLRFTSTPVVPYIQLITGLTGVAGFYSNNDSQLTLTTSVGLIGQFGHFSRTFFDYTGFNIIYSKGFYNELSPFFFDRFVDDSVLSMGITQQIVGPLRIGFQTSYNLDTGKEITTDYFIEWSRRTYSLLIRYNPVLELGSINLRISDFNWVGNPGYFEDSGIRPVIDGVRR